MIQRRLVFGSLIVLFLLACAPASVVIASDQWCEDDPPPRAPHAGRGARDGLRHR